MLITTNFKTVSFFYLCITYKREKIEEDKETKMNFFKENSIKIIGEKIQIY